VSLISDLNPFFPVPPCEYGGPLQALRAGDYESVFGGLPGQVDHLPLFPKGQLARHNLLEGIHVLNKVAPRVARWLRGEGDIMVNWDILTEGYSHHTPEPRTIQFGHDTHRDPDLILDDDKFVVHAGSMLEELYSKQPLLKEIFGELYNMKKLLGKAKK